MVIWMRLDDTLHTDCLSCSLLWFCSVTHWSLMYTAVASFQVRRGGGCSLQQMYGWVCPTRYYPMGRGHGPIYNSHCPAKVWASNNVTPVYHATSPLHLTHPEDDISNVYHNRVTSTHDTSELQKSKLHITYLFEFPIKKYTLNPIYNE